MAILSTPVDMAKKGSLAQSFQVEPTVKLSAPNELEQNHCHNKLTAPQAATQRLPPDALLRDFLMAYGSQRKAY